MYLSSSLVYSAVKNYSSVPWHQDYLTTEGGATLPIPEVDGAAAGTAATAAAAASTAVPASEVATATTATAATADTAPAS